MRALLAVALVCLLFGIGTVASSDPGAQGSLETGDAVSVVHRAWYITGPSTFAAWPDLPWPGDNGLLSSNVNAPIYSLGGFWTAFKYHVQPPGVVLAHANNSVGGTTIGNYASAYTCRETGTNAWRLPCAGIGDDQTCDLERDGNDDDNATCVASPNYYAESVGNPSGILSWEGMQAIIPSVFTFSPGLNECLRTNMTAEKIYDVTVAFLAEISQIPSLERIVLFKGPSWGYGPIATNAVCKDLWESWCVTCDKTFEDAVALFPKAIIDDASFLAVNGKWMPSGQTFVHLVMHADGLHPNVWGSRTYVYPALLESAGIALDDVAPPTPVPELSSKDASSITVNLSEAVVDPDGDDLTCVVWAYVDAAFYSATHQGADRVHNGWNVCKVLNGGTPCANCGDGLVDADCNAAGQYTNANADDWLTASDAPVQADGVNPWDSMPDLYEVDCAGVSTATIKGLASATTYRILAWAVPDIVPGTLEGIRASTIDDTLVVTTD